MNILLIEPDKLLAKNLSSQFESKGVNVDYRFSAQTALDALDEKSNIHCIVIEIQLGLHNGVEYLYEIRSHAGWQDIPVVIHTSNRNVLHEEFRDGWASLGVRDILYKPQITFSKLLSTIKQAA